MNRMVISYQYLNEVRAYFPSMQAEFMRVSAELRSDRGRNGCLTCLKPAAFVSAIAKGLPLALTAATNGDNRLAFRQGKWVAKMVIQLNGDTLIERYHQRAMFPAAKGKCSTHDGSLIGHTTSAVILSYKMLLTQDA